MEKRHSDSRLTHVRIFHSLPLEPSVFLGGFFHWACGLQLLLGGGGESHVLRGRRRARRDRRVLKVTCSAPSSPASCQAGRAESSPRLPLLSDSKAEGGLVSSFPPVPLGLITSYRPCTCRNREHIRHLRNSIKAEPHRSCS